MRLVARFLPAYLLVETQEVVTRSRFVISFVISVAAVRQEICYADKSTVSCLYSLVLRASTRKELAPDELLATCA
jgi:hypothetical protein